MTAVPVLVTASVTAINLHTLHEVRHQINKFNISSVELTGLVYFTMKNRLAPAMSDL